MWINMCVYFIGCFCAISVDLMAKKCSSRYIYSIGIKFNQNYGCKCFGIVDQQDFSLAGLNKIWNCFDVDTVIIQFSSDFVGRIALFSSYFDYYVQLYSSCKSLAEKCQFKMHCETVSSPSVRFNGYCYTYVHSMV